MKNFTLKMFMMACIFLVAGYSNAQVKLGDKSSVGQTYAKSAETQTAVLTIDFNTDKGNSTWTEVDDTTTTISWSKCQNNKGFAVTVWAADSANAATVNPNDDLRVRSGRWRSNENPVHVASVDSLEALMAKWAEVYAGTDDSTTNTISKPSGCLFDVGGDDANQAYGMHPGIYKKLEHEMVFTFKNMVLKSDLEFTIDTYHAGNTGQTATYDLRVKGNNVADTTIENFYVTGSGLKQVKLAETLGMEISELDGDKELHIFLSTNGTGTAIAEGTYDPIIVVDDMTVSFVAPVWIEPAGGLDGGNFDNAEAPFMGMVGEETTVTMPLKINGRVAPLSIEDNLYKNDRGEEFNKMLTFPDTLGIMANDGSGNYTVEVPYTLNPAVFDMGGQKWSKQKITIDAPAVAGDEDMMFSFKVLPEAATYRSNIEIDAGVRIFYKVHVKGTGSTVVDLTEMEDGYILRDTLTGVPDKAQIILAPGKMYYIGGYAFDKSMEFISSDPDAEMKPLIDCSSAGEGYGSNFDMVADSSVDFIIFRDLKFTGSFDDNYVMNISKQSSIGSVVFDGCEAKMLRGIVRIKDNPSTIDNYTVNNCVMDSINNYGLLTMDKDGGMVKNISITNSTFSHFTYFIVNRNNSDKLSILNSTLSEVPEKGRQLLRYRGSDGSNNVLTELQIEKTLIGHGWNMSGELDYGIKGKQGLDSTPLRIRNVYATNDFAYSGDTIPGLPTHTYDGAAMDLWVDMMNGNFNYHDESFAGKGIGDPRWVYQDTTAYVLFVGSGAADEKHQSDVNVIEALTNEGYNISYVSGNDFAVEGFDYSAYEAAILSAGNSSSKIVQFAKDGYQLPVVSMQPDAARSDKWGWTGSKKNDGKEMFVSKNYNATTAQMTVSDNGHYITEGYTVDQMLSWTIGTVDSADWSGREVKAYILTDSIPEAVALGAIATDDANTMSSWWAVPDGSSVRSVMSDGSFGRVELENRIVLMNLFNDGLLYPGDDFAMMLAKSLDWVMGAGPITSIDQNELVDANDILVYPNPAKAFAKVRFTMNESAEGSLSLYNMVGQKIEISTNERFNVGVNEIEINTQRLNEGLYIYVLEAGTKSYQGKLLIKK